MCSESYWYNYAHLNLQHICNGMTGMWPCLGMVDVSGPIFQAGLYLFFHDWFLGFGIHKDLQDRSVQLEMITPNGMKRVFILKKPYKFVQICKKIRPPFGVNPAWLKDSGGFGQASFRSGVASRGCNVGWLFSMVGKPLMTISWSHIPWFKDGQTVHFVTPASCLTSWWTTSMSLCWVSVPFAKNMSKNLVILDPMYLLGLGNHMQTRNNKKNRHRFTIPHPQNRWADLRLDHLFGLMVHRLKSWGEFCFNWATKKNTELHRRGGCCCLLQGLSLWDSLWTNQCNVMFFSFS